MSAFHYKQKQDTVEPVKSTGHPLRYCDGVKYGTTTYTPEARPVCPAELTDNRIHEKGLLTVYKPNIVPETRRIIRCRRGTTYIYSGTKFFWFFRRYNNQPLITKFFPTSAEECQKMWKTKTSPTGQKLQTTLIGNSTYTEFATNNDKGFKYSGYSSHERTVTDYYMEVSILIISMPSLTMTSPWNVIPRSRLYKTSFMDHESTSVWDQLKPTDLCLHVPRVTMEVEAITYPSTKHLEETASSPGAGNQTFFVGHKAVWDVDDRMIVNNTYNCITRAPGDIIYVSKGGDVYKWTKDGKLHTASTTKPHLFGAPNEVHHAHSSYTELQKDSNGKVVNVQNKHTDGHELGDSSVIDAKDLAPASPQQPPRVIPKKNASNDVTIRETVAYLEFQQTETQNRNVHARAVANCKQNQLAWDTFVNVLNIFPSAAISSRIRHPIQAIQGGHGHYTIKKCELITESTILTSLFTNTTASYVINGRTIKFTEVMKKLKVAASNRKCLTYPLIKFKLGGSNYERIGQMTLDGTVNTGVARHLEECRHNRLLVFPINGVTHFFKDYAHVAIEATSVVNKKLASINAAHDAIKSKQINPLLDPLNEYINQIHLIPLTEPLLEGKYTNLATGHVASSEYSLEERQSADFVLTELMQERTYAQLGTRIIKEKTISDYTGSNTKSGGIFDDFGSAFGGLDDLVLDAGRELLDAGGKVIDAVVDDGTKILDGVTDAVVEMGGNLAHTVGDGIGIFDKFLRYGLPVIGGILIISGLAYVYVKFIRPNMKDDAEKFLTPEDNEQDEPPKYDDVANSDDIEMGGNSVRKRKNIL